MRSVVQSNLSPHAVLRVCMLFGLSLCIGCARSGPAIPADADRPLRAELDTEQARIIVERWLPLPVRSDEKALSLGIASGSYTVVSSA